MKILTHLNTAAVSGGKAESLTVTTKVSLNGISDKCINTLATIAPLLCPNISEEMLNSIDIALLQNCTFEELDLLDERIDNAPFLTVSYN